MITHNEPEPASQASAPEGTHGAFVGASSEFSAAHKPIALPLPRRALPLQSVPLRGTILSVLVATHRGILAAPLAWPLASSPHRAWLLHCFGPTRASKLLSLLLSSPGVSAQDRRCLDLGLYGATRLGEALCCDATLVASLRRDVPPQPRAADEDGARKTVPSFVSALDSKANQSL